MFRSHMLTCTVASDKCTRENPCERCQKVLVHFTKPHHEIFAAMDAAQPLSRGQYARPGSTAGTRTLGIVPFYSTATPPLAVNLTRIGCVKLRRWGAGDRLSAVQEDGARRAGRLLAEVRLRRPGLLHLLLRGLPQPHHPSPRHPHRMLPRVPLRRL